jgi:hypothetical protein
MPGRHLDAGRGQRRREFGVRAIAAFAPGAGPNGFSLSDNRASAPLAAAGAAQSAAAARPRPVNCVHPEAQAAAVILSQRRRLNSMRFLQPAGGFAGQH